MKVIIAGSRYLDNMDAVDEAMRQAAREGIVPTEIVSGGAHGADTLGELWARHHDLPIRVFTARWWKHGRAAGPLRNEEMATYADALVALPARNSRDTSDMIGRAIIHNLKLYVYPI